jgi:hypothetical protein
MLADQLHAGAHQRMKSVEMLLGHPLSHRWVTSAVRLVLALHVGHLHKKIIHKIVT